MLLLTDADVVAAFEGRSAMKEAIDVVEASFLAAFEGRASGSVFLLTHPERSEVYGSLDFVLGATWGIWPEVGVAGGRMLGLRAEDISKSTSSPDTLQYWRPVWSTTSGDLIALMPDGFAGKLVVGAHVAVATRCLSRADSSTLAVIGSGELAAASLEAICQVRPIELARVYSPTKKNRERFAAEWSDRLNIDVVASESTSDACVGADIITLATSAHGTKAAGHTVLNCSDVPDGCHVNTIAGHETDVALNERALVVPSSTARVRDFGIPIEPTTSMLRAGRIPPSHLVGDLVELIGRKARVRSSPEDVTLYVGPSLGFQHAAISSLIVDVATRSGRGLQWNPISGTIS